MVQQILQNCSSLLKKIKVLNTILVVSTNLKTTVCAPNAKNLILAGKMVSISVVVVESLNRSSSRSSIKVLSAANGSKIRMIAGILSDLTPYSRSCVSTLPSKLAVNSYLY